VEDAFLNIEHALVGLSITAEKARHAGIVVICLILAITVHEFAHAFAAHKLKDPTPEAQGRLTLNPVAHADPIGTLALPLILSLTSIYFFGWGKPVQTQPQNYTRKITMRAGMALVAFAGPLSNLLLATLTLGVAWGLHAGGVIAGPVLAGHPIHIFYTLNILLFVFNLLPVHPLDGGKVLGWLLGPRYQHIDDFLARYGFVILILLMFSGALGILFQPFYRWGTVLLDSVTIG
jgi:Zn-dependent protease